MFSMPGRSFEGPLPALTLDERLSAENLRRHVAALASVEHNVFKPAELEAAAQYIERELQALRYAVRPQPYRTSFGMVRNIEVELPGRSSELVVVGAHYDSVSGSPGANDNGSGVAATLELARLMRDSMPDRTVRFVWFVNEEPPFFTGEDMGSRRYVRALKQSGSRVAAMFSLETIGYYDEGPGTQRYPPLIAALYPGTGNFIAFVANLASRRLLREALGAFRQHARFPSEGAAMPAFVPGVDWSDHASFWEARYPALMVTDTALYRYPHYHLPSDTPDKLDYERLARVVTGLHGMLREVSAAR
jgi:Zn-dependent M28 family amino/carboxypeptidase